MLTRLLMIDDEFAMCDFVRDVARDAGYEVVTSNRVEEFKAALAAANPHVIVLDLTMPGVDGIELLHFLAEMGVRANILIVSGYDETVRRMAFVLGAARGLTMAGVLAKPVRAAELRALLTRLRDGI